MQSATCEKNANRANLFCKAAADELEKEQKATKRTEQVLDSLLGCLCVLLFDVVVAESCTGLGRRLQGFKQLLGILLITCLLFSVESAVAQSSQDWWVRSNEFRTRYYHVKTDLSETHARHLATHMDITFEAYAQLFDGLKARWPGNLDLYLFASQQDYNQVLHERFHVAGTGSWGMAITRQGETSLAAWEGKYSLTDMESVLQHEGFHQFARYLFPKLPSWANEGLAEVFQRGVEVDGKIVLGEVSERDLLMLARATKERKFRSFDQFFTMDGRVWNQHVQRGEANTNYLQAWCLVHFFLYADGAKHQSAFMDFLVGLNNELPWQKAFVRAYGSPDFTAMQQKWLAYINQLQPANYRETIRRLDFLSAGMKALQVQEIYPLTLAELRAELQNIDFQHPSNLFEEPRAMLAAEEVNFEVPTSPRSQAKPSQPMREFRLVGSSGEPVVRPADDKALAKLQRRLARQPLQIVTTGLEPRNLIVKWKRAGKRDFRPILATD